MTNLNNYDIIIENAQKEYFSMLDTQTKNNWDVPKYSKKEIERAGQVIIKSNASTEEMAKAIAVLNNWRSAHAYPLQVIASNLRRNNKNAIVAQRLKRLESITGKLRRFPSMSLYRMQDLGGCRVIVKSINQVYEAVNKYKNSTIPHILQKEYDYIYHPKSSGYRSYHAVYKFQSDNKPEYNKNMLIEIQFRTQLQHIWATAVEIMGIYTKSQLKASMGDEDILRFFAVVSSVFSIKESTPVCLNTSDNYNDLIEEIIYLENKLNILSKLDAMSSTIERINKIKNARQNKNGYFILILDYEHRNVEVFNFPKENIDLATNIYNTLENEQSNIDVVLVSTTSFNTLREAYPNYFVDTSQFIKIIKDILN